MNKTLIIAEAGVNHNGSIDIAKSLIDAAINAKADIVKFQSFRAEQLVTKKAKMAEYQIKNTGAENSQFSMLKSLELNKNDHKILFNYCGEKNIEFLSTPFDREGLRFLADNEYIKRIKISSGDLTNALLLFEAAKTNLPIILSTGMSSLKEVENALTILFKSYKCQESKPEKIAAYFKNSNERLDLSLLKDKVTILQCTTEYPAPYEEVNLKAIEKMKSEFGLDVGLSDHTNGIFISVAAVALGATVIEKHFTLDKTMQGPDHRASLEPAELSELVYQIRTIEKAMGDGSKNVTSSEIKNQEIARKSLVALSSIKKGERFTMLNLGVKRPGLGKSPSLFWDILDTEAEKDYQEDDFI